VTQNNILHSTAFETYFIPRVLNQGGILVFQGGGGELGPHRLTDSNCWNTDLSTNNNSTRESIIFWDVTRCSLLSCNRRFGGTYSLHLQGRRNRFSKTGKQAGGKGLHGVISQKMILFITTAVKTSNPTYNSTDCTIYRTAHFIGCHILN
jgi:hypothetical protein